MSVSSDHNLTKTKTSSSERVVVVPMFKAYQSKETKHVAVAPVVFLFFSVEIVVSGRGFGCNNTLSYKIKLRVTCSSTDSGHINVIKK